MITKIHTTELHFCYQVGIFLSLLTLYFNIAKYDTSHLLLWMISKSWQCKFTQFKAECLFGEGCWNRGGWWGTRPSHFLADQLTLSQPGGQIVPPTLSFVPPRLSDLPTFLFALSWVNILTLGTEIFLFGRMG